MGYILSVVIPTRNRLHYLRGCIESINNYKRNDVEVIVQDNSDNHDEVEAFILSLENPNIKYFYDGRKLSQTENSELAFMHVSGKYAVYIGDDDTICESIIELAYVMDRCNIDAATYGISTYNWPDLIEAVPDAFTLKYFEFDETKVEYVEPKEALKDALHNGMQDISRLPRVYHGIVSKNLLDRIYIKTKGSFFPGPSPDMANATACALLANNQIHINIPMIISGFGKNSAGGMGKRKLHVGSLKGNFQLRDDVEDTWDIKIPKRWMQSTIWPNSATTAIKSLGVPEYLGFLNYGIIASETILHDRHSIKSVFSCKLSFTEYVTLFTHSIKRVFIRFSKKKRNNNEVVIFEPMTILEAASRQNSANVHSTISKSVVELIEIKK